MKGFIKISSLLFLIVVISSCYNKKKPQVQYMADTDMYTPVGYETYGEYSVFKDSMEAQKPVAGTIARGGTIAYEYEDSQAGYEAARDSLRSPLKIKGVLDSIAKVSDADLDRGKYLYDIYCATCHGTKGDGQGPLVQNEKFLGIPNYKDRAITEGSIYHVIMYGRNLMGSHSSQLNAKERWQVTHYVEKLRNDLLK